MFYDIISLFMLRVNNALNFIGEASDEHVSAVLINGYVTLFFCAVLFAIAYLSVKWLSKHNMAMGGDAPPIEVITTILLSLTVFICLLVGVINITMTVPQIVKATVAPKTVQLDYIAGLTKR